MDWTEQDKAFLQQFRNTVDYDGIKVKQKVKQALLDNKYILHVLNNKELEEAEAEPSDYFGINILPYYMVTPVQTDVQNYVTFQVNYASVPQWDKTKKYLELIFVVLCEQKNIIDKDTSLPRHDLLAALLQDQFNFSTICGHTIELVKDREIIVDNSYAARELTFQQYADNNLVKTRNGVSKLSNKSMLNV